MDEGQGTQVREFRHDDGRRWRVVDGDVQIWLPETGLWQASWLYLRDLVDDPAIRETTQVVS